MAEQRGSEIPSSTLPYSFSGYFWRSNQPQSRLAGTLDNIPGEKIVLRLHGSLHSFEEILKPDATGTIFGELSDGRPISLFDSFIIEAQFNAPEPYCTYQCNYIVIGLQTPDSQGDVGCKRIRIHYSALAHWAVPITTFHLQGDSTAHERGVVLAADPGLAQGACDLDSHWGLSVGRTVTWGCGSPRAQITISPCVDMFMTDDPCRLEDIFEHELRLTNLLYALLGFRGPVDRIELDLGGGEDDLQTKCLLGVPLRSKRIEVLAHDTIVSYEFFARNIDTIVSNWLSIYDPSKLPLILISEADSDSNGFPNTRFTIAAQAIECLHRTWFDSHFVGVEDYDKIQNAMISAIPSTCDRTLRSALKTRLRYGNQVSLRRRVRELIRELPEELRRSFFPDPERFHDRFADTRNHFTHWDDGSKGDVFSSSEIPIAIAKAKQLVIFHVLLRLLPEIDVQAEILRRSETCQQLRYARRSLTPRPSAP